MNPVLHWLTSPEWSQAVKALLHSLWQGGVLALLLGLALRHVSAPEWRYRLTLGALGGLLLASLFTWAVLNQTAEQRNFQTGVLKEKIAPVGSSSPQPVTQNDPLVVTITAKPSSEAVTASVRWTAWTALVWLLGAMLMLARAGLQVAGAERLRRSGKPLADPGITQLLAETQRAVRLVRKVRVAVTDTLTSPAVVGVLVPTLILPLSLVTTLTHEQLRFVLLHELAHIRRGDYFANLFQLFVEALLFFNPAVWWISQQVRREREACCDALAIELSGAPVDYARTLVQVAESALSPSPAAAAAFGNKQREPSSLIDRVQRLLVPGYRPALRLTWRAMLISLFAGGTLLVLSAIGTRTTVGAILANEKSLDQQADAAKTNGTAQTARTNAISETRTNAFSDLVRPIDSSDKRRSGPRIAWVSFHTDSTTMTNAVSGAATLSSIPWASYFGGLGRELIVGDTRAAGVDQRLRSVSTELELSQLRRVLLRYQFTDAHPQVKLIDQEIARLETEKALLEIEALTTLRFDFSASQLMRQLGPTTPLVTTDIHTLTNKVPVLDDLPLVGRLFRSSSNEASTGVEETNRLYSRRFKIEPDKFPTEPPHVNYEGGIYRLTRTNKMQAATQAIRSLFASSGVDLQPPKSVFYNDRLGELFVRASLTDLDRITPLLAEYVETTPADYNGTNAVMLVQSARLLLEAGKPDEAEAKLKSALEMDPENQAAYYYLSWIKESRYRRASGGQVVRTNRTDGVAEHKTTKSSAAEDGSQLHVRRYKVDLKTFTKNLEGTAAHQANPTNVTRAVRDFLSISGVELEPPKSIYINDRAGELLIRATREDLDIVEEVLQVLNAQAMQININVRFVEVDSQNGFGWIIGNMLQAATNSSTGDFPVQFSGILTEPQYQVVLRALEERKDAKVLAMQQVTTSSGQQAQIQTVELKTVINGMNLPLPALPGHATTNSSSNPAYQTQVLPFGAVLDVIPYVAADGHTIQMTLLPTVSEFLGYDDPAKLMNGSQKLKGEAELPLPRMRVRQMTLNVNVWDGQTLFLGTASEEILSKKPDGSIERNPSRETNKQLLIFITPTIIDQGGNRMHSGGALPIERTTPPQTPRN